MAKKEPVKVVVKIDSEQTRYQLRIEGTFADSRELDAESLANFGKEFIAWCGDGEMFADGPIEIEVTPM